ncbi:MAG: NAD(P)/FAD-dependent oxidoreductase [Nitrospinaceae bacterium]|jgi:phytoene dehydrogenase-like protein|nr:MAG: NAD(P)/FAD-dependent oxidoreductase [Nitrospinaceae bacterium]
MDYDVIIIGSGLSGLAAGIRLAQFDTRVLIVEKHTVAGGLNSYYVRKNRTFDVGLHAMTNYSKKGDRSSPLGKLLKQLRFRHEDFRLRQQHQSEIRFPGHSLSFTNEFEFFEAEVARQFPSQIDGFRKLVKIIEEFDELNLDDRRSLPSRPVLESCLSDPVFIDMLFCPLMFYGSAREREMDFYQFVIMFKSIFMQGLAKPEGGMKYILDLMVERYRKLGGELRLGAEVAAIDTAGGEVKAVTLAGGERLEVSKVISSVGYVETLLLTDPPCPGQESLERGQLSFMESLFVLGSPARDLGYDKSIVFFSTRLRFDYRVPEGLTDPASGVLCCPDNFDLPQVSGEGLLRLTSLANFALWDRLPRREYIQAKKEERARALDSLLTFFPDFRDSVLFLDSFTPKTIKKYTGHLNGAVYGAPNKIKSGATPIKNLYICGTDQGFLGIVGATLSGITIANLHVLKEWTGS